MSNYNCLVACNDENFVFVWAKTSKATFVQLNNRLFNTNNTKSKFDINYCPDNKASILFITHNFQLATLILSYNYNYYNFIIIHLCKELTSIVSC